ncbi:MAG: 1-acyl-sn-glycerol-3-phosphate acyltransferase [Flavobacteriales bacterium]|nr:1-acyl-sn-glycerol-3-phosphate acyltransferase [Flavobacteriales bacterium]|tara:strand:+ start:2999 stop:3736 length:738 start_codon:yes stop_codon:yes gene_type:complete
MKWIRYLFSSIWRLWFLISFIIAFIVFIPTLFFFTAIVKNNLVVNYLTKYWSGMFMIMSGVFWTVEFEEKLDPKRKYIFCPNHASTLDIPLVTAAIPLPMLFMGKKELVSIPLFGYFYRKNSIIVDRSKIRDSYAAFLKAGEKLDKGLNVCIFPEGGIPPAKIFLKKFKNGPFKLAVEKDIFIVPITLLDNKKNFPQEYYRGYPGIVRVKVHKPIKANTEDKNAVESLNTSAYNTIFEQLKIYGS